MPDLRRNRYLELAIVLAVCAFLFFYGLGSFGLLGADEPRYAQIGVEMLARHDWIVPTLNGTPWLEKPALLYWSEMASYAVFGVHDWSARVPVALMTTAMILAIYLFVRRRSPAWALDAALITAAMAGAIGFGRAASTDMPLTACLAIALLAWFEWVTASEPRVVHPGRFCQGGKQWLFVFYLFCALGMFAKGPVAPFLAAVIIVAFAAVLQRGKLILQTLWWPGILLFLAVSLPWYVAVQLKTGDFFRVFILEHNLERFGTNLYRHHQPFWYYLPVGLALMLPWSAIFIAEAVDLWRAARGKSLGNPRVLFLALWFLVPIVFFSLSQSKLPGYVLPSLPPAALLIAGYLESREDRRLPTLVAIFHAVLCGLLFAGVLLAPHFLLPLHPSAAAIATAVIAGAIVAIVVAGVLFRRGVHLVHAVTLLPIVLGIAFVVRVAAPTIDATQSARPVAEQLHALDYPATSPVLLFQVKRETEYGLRFYRGSGSAIHYDGGPLPVTSALILTRAGSRPALESSLPKNVVLSHVADFAPQKLEFYMASPPVH